MNGKTIIIAEAGVNHNGDLRLAETLVDEAAKCGADYIKFQTFKAEDLVTYRARTAEYQVTNAKKESQLDLLASLEMSREMHEIVLKRCNQKSIGFMSTAFDIPSLYYLESIGVNLIKVPSGEITNLPYLRHVAYLGKKIVLSTGMCTLGEIEDAISVLESCGAQRSSITVLHCNTEYPTPMCDVNLSAMCSIRKAFKTDVGYSDHTLGIEIPIAAVALGAKVIEKHFTVDRTLPGPDHRASLEPNQLREMVTAIRNIEVAVGNGIKRPTDSESKNRIAVRKSIVAVRVIQSGELFDESNLTCKRPGDGVSPMFWDKYIGKRANRMYEKDELIDPL